MQPPVLATCLTPIRRPDHTAPAGPAPGTEPRTIPARDESTRFRRSASRAARWLGNALGVACLLLGAPAGAVDYSAERYPWDMRPIKCADPLIAQTLTCVEDEWSGDPDVVLARLSELGGLHRFSLLERAMTEIGQSRKQLATGRPLGPRLAGRASAGGLRVVGTFTMMLRHG